MARVRSKAAALFVAAAAVMLAAACGGGSDDATTKEQPSGGNNAFAAHTECLSKNGVTITMPSGGPRNGGASRGPGAFPSGRPRPSAGMPRPSAGMPRPSGSGGARGGMFGKPAGIDDATWEKAQSACASLRPGGRPGGRRNAAYENCLKENGVTVTEGLNTADATVKKAMETCEVLRQAAPSASPAA